MQGRRKLSFNPPIREAFADLTPALAPNVPFRACVDQVATACLIRGADCLTAAKQNAAGRAALDAILGVMMHIYADVIKSGRQSHPRNPMVDKDALTPAQQAAVREIEAKRAVKIVRAYRLLTVLGLALWWDDEGLPADQHPVPQLLAEAINLEVLRAA